MAVYSQYWSHAREYDGAERVGGSLISDRATYCVISGRTRDKRLGCSPVRRGAGAGRESGGGGGDKEGRITSHSWKNPGERGQRTGRGGHRQYHRRRDARRARRAGAKAKLQTGSSEVCVIESGLLHRVCEADHRCVILRTYVRREIIFAAPDDITPWFGLGQRPR